jgi:hypothetical protein
MRAGKLKKKKYIDNQIRFLSLYIYIYIYIYIERERERERDCAQGNSHEPNQKQPYLFMN